MGRHGTNEVEHSCPPDKLILVGFCLDWMIGDVDFHVPNEAEFRICPRLCVWAHHALVGQVFLDVLGIGMVGRTHYCSYR